MANDLTGNPWVCDTVGLLWDSPICIKQMIFFPNAAGNGAVFYTYDPTSPLCETSGATTTVATGVITSTGAFTTAKVTAYGVIEIGPRSVKSTGAVSSNVGKKRLIASRDSDNQITTAPTDLTDEASAVYYFKTYTPLKRIVIESAGTEKLTETVYFPGEGLHLPNLVLATMDDSCAVHIFI